MDGVGTQLYRYLSLTELAGILGKEKYFLWLADKLPHINTLALQQRCVDYNTYFLKQFLLLKMLQQRQFFTFFQDEKCKQHGYHNKLYDDWSFLYYLGMLDYELLQEKRLAQLLEDLRLGKLKKQSKRKIDQEGIQEQDFFRFLRDYYWLQLQSKNKLHLQPEPIFATKQIMLSLKQYGKQQACLVVNILPSGVSTQPYKGVIARLRPKANRAHLEKSLSTPLFSRPR